MTLFFLSPAAPKAVTDCMGSVLCRELLSAFRKGDFSCRFHEPCLDALDAIVGRGMKCNMQTWCMELYTINDLYNTDAKTKCFGITPAECSRKIGAGVGIESSFTCRYDTECFKEMREMTRNLTGEGDRHATLEPACMLWKECRESLEADKRWACAIGGREAMCRKHTAVWEYLTVTKPACVRSGHTKICQDAIKALVK